MKKISPQLLKLIDLLNDCKVHDGEALGERLAISRAAVWKMINKLKELGVPIDATKSKGYILRKPLLLLSSERISQALLGLPVTITCLESIASTNDYFKSVPAEFSELYEVCLAEKQTAGRGRLGRTWFSPFAQNLYMSCRFFCTLDMSELGGLSLVIGISIVTALKSMGYNDELLVKWPNDVMLDNKKLAGILVEVRAEAHGICEVVMGIGINVNLSPLDAVLGNELIGQLVSALCHVHGKIVDRNELVIYLVKQLIIDITLFKQAGWHAFKERFAAVDYLQGKAITLLQGEKKSSGKAMGVNEHGYLLLQVENGEVNAFSSGETSVGKGFAV